MGATTTPATFRHRNGTESRQQEGRQQARLKVRQGQRRRKGSTQRLECAQDTQSPPEHHLPPTQDSHPVEKSKIPTHVFIVNVKANKQQIKAALKQMYDVETVKINTLIRPDGTKKAYARLTPDLDALDVAATKLSIV